MEKRFHSTSHLGRGGIELPPDYKRTSVTMRDIEVLADWIYAKLQLAIFKGSEVMIRELERQALALTQFADKLAGEQS
jgi:hypothetical protein